MQRSGWYVRSQSGRCLLRAPFSFGPHFRSTINDDGDLRGTVMVLEGYTGMIQPSERDVLEAYQDAAQQKARRLAAEDEGSEASRPAPLTHADNRRARREGAAAAC